MTRFKIVLWLALLLTFSIAAPAIAQEAEADVLALADYYPASSTYYMAMRIDEAFIDELDAVLDLVYGGLDGMPVPQLNLRQLFRLSTQQDLDSWLAWLGDTMAYGIYDLAAFQNGDLSGTGFPGGAYLTLELENMAAAEAFFDAAFAASHSKTTAIDRIVYTNSNSVNVVLTAEVAYILPGQIPSFAIPILQVRTRLSNSDSFQRVRAELLADDYSAYIYFDTPAYFALPGTANPLSEDENLGPSGVALDLVDNELLLLDVVQLPARPYDNAALRMDASLTRRVPASMSGFLQVADFSSSLDSTLSFIDTLNQVNAPASAPSEDFTAILAAVGIDLQADLLDWATGDALYFGAIDSLPIAKAALQSQVAVSGHVELGLMLDASADPQAAQALADKLRGLLAEAAEASEDVTVTSETIAGVEATVLALNIPFDNPFVPIECNGPPIPQESIKVDFVLAANDEIFLFATRDVAEEILAGDVETSIVETAAYQQALADVVPDASFLAYTDGEGFLTSYIANPVVILTLLGPQIGCIFENIVAELNAESTLTPAPTPTIAPTATPDPVLIEQQLAPLRYALRVIDSSSLSWAITAEGVIQLRFALRYSAE